MQFTGETACATTGKSLACIGGRAGACHNGSPSLVANARFSFTAYAVAAQSLEVARVCKRLAALA